jgi:hypothetical protein
MSIQSNISNYGGRVNDFQQNIKQFISNSTSSVASWIYKRLINGLLVQTPANPNIPVYINNDLIVVGSIIQGSKGRSRENIIEIPINAVDNLNVLNPIQFNLKNTEITQLHYGLDIEEVKQLFPELVSNQTNIHYQEFIPLMLAKLKHLQKQIDEIID